MQSITEKLSAWHLKQAYRSMRKDVMAHIPIMQRLGRAYGILTTEDEYSIEVTSRNPLTFSVKSPNDTYTVIESQQMCTCPDGEKLCKHRLTVRLILLTHKLMKADSITLERTV